MREFNPSVETPGDIIHKITQLRGRPDEHKAKIAEELDRANGKLEFLENVSDPNFAVQTLIAYARRTDELLRAELASRY